MKQEILDQLPKFLTTIEEQFLYGDEKYKTTGAETVDEIVSTFGKGWLFGTMWKYGRRYQNVGRERDLQKIATYSYILWLKRGYWVQECGVDSPVININTELKKAHLAQFTSKIQGLLEYDKSNLYLLVYNKKDIFKVQYMERILQILKELVEVDWAKVDCAPLYEITAICFLEWYFSFVNKQVG